LISEPFYSFRYGFLASRGRYFCFAGEAMTAEDLALLGITAPTILMVLSWGFGVILFGWSLGYGASVALTIIKKI